MKPLVIPTLVFLFSGLLSQLSAVEPVILTEKIDQFNLGEKCVYLEDELNILKFSEATHPDRQPEYASNQQKSGGFGYTTSTFWLQCRIYNPLAQPLSLHLEIPYPLLDDIRLFYNTQGNDITEIRTGDTYPFLQRPLEYRNFLFPILMEPRQDLSLTFRISNRGAVIAPVILWTHNELIKKISFENILIGLFLGISLAMAVYNIFLYRFFRELHYLYYVCFLAGLTGIILTLTGVSFQYLWPNSIWWSNYNFPILLFFTAVWGILFTRAMLGTKKNGVFYDRVLIVFAYANAIGIALPILVDYVYSLRIALMFLTIQSAIVFTIIVHIYWKNEFLSKYFPVAWTAFFLGILIYQMHSLGWLPTNFFTTWMVYLGASLEIILFSLALGEHIHTVRDEKEKAQEEMIRIQQIALENANTNQIQAEQIIALNQEMKIAREIHESILPQNLPEIPGVKIHVEYIPMAEIGGDLYEFVEDSSNQALGILVADVTGHGIPAAQVSSMVKAAFTFHKPQYRKPDVLLSEMNRTLLSIQNNQMVSAGYLFLDLNKRLARYANSGHPPLLLWRKETNLVQSFYPEGKILGWMEDSENKMIELSFQPGDRFFLFTDGITDVRKNTSDIWGEERFTQFILDHIHLPTEEFHRELIQTLRSYGNLDSGFEDDITLVTIQV